jgi:hypothetical protein
MANTSLKKANKAKKDEFYTQLTDIEKECRHYTVFSATATILTKATFSSILQWDSTIWE